MGDSLRGRTAISGLALALAALPLTFAAPPTSWADDGCGAYLYYNTATAQCEYCDVLYYNVATDQCEYWDDPTVYINPAPIVGPIGPGPVGPGPIGPGPIGPGPIGPGPVGPGPVGPGRR